MSEEYKNQIQKHSGAVAIPAHQCPLEPTMFLQYLDSTGLKVLERIELHISTSKCHHQRLKEVVLQGSLVLNGITPLLLACFFGDLRCVKHIVENWRVDFQAAGFSYIGFPRYCRRIESATPLFVAAFTGHIEIVKYLIGLGADVSSKTSSETDRDLDGLTPLHGAMKQSPFDPDCLVIVRFLLESGADPSALPSSGSPIWMVSYCGVDATTSLIQHGLNLNQRNWLGQTILHHWAHHATFLNSWDWDTHSFSRAALAVIELLVNSGADLMAQDKRGFTPLLYAASHCSFAVVNFLTTRDYTDRMEIIDGMEMAAAKILYRHSSYGESEQERAFEYLRRALDLRQIDSLPMTPLKLKRGRTIGWTTAAQLDQVIEQPAEFILQSYLIQLRICSARCWKAVFSLKIFLWNCIDTLKKKNRFVDLLDMLWATLETIQLHLTDSHEDHELWSMTDYVVSNLIRTLSQLERNDPLFNAGNFKTILKVVLATDAARGPRSANLRCQSHMNALLELVTFLSHLPEEILNEESQEPLSINELLRLLVSQDSRNELGESLLHLACYAKHLDLITIHHLLEAGADPNARDDGGNASLHVLAVQRLGNGETIASAARLLLEYGAHLHLVNKERETAEDVWIKVNQKKEEEEIVPEIEAPAEIEGNPEMEAEAPPEMQVLPVPEVVVLPQKEALPEVPEWLRESETIPMLTCLCARFIRPFLFAYKKGEDFPATLGDFIEWH